MADRMNAQFDETHAAILHVRNVARSAWKLASDLETDDPSAETLEGLLHLIEEKVDLAIRSHYAEGDVRQAAA